MNGCLHHYLHNKVDNNDVTPIDLRGHFRELFHYDCFTDECIDSIHLSRANQPPNPVKDKYQYI